MEDSAQISGYTWPNIQGLLKGTTSVNSRYCVTIESKYFFCLRNRIKRLVIHFFCYKRLDFKNLLISSGPYELTWFCSCFAKPIQIMVKDMQRFVDKIQNLSWPWDAHLRVRRRAIHTFRRTLAPICKNSSILSWLLS